jgi:DNA-directed RNA polymerase subunit RPC12/RpoP
MRHTIRDHVKKRTRWAIGVAAIACLVVMLSPVRTHAVLMEMPTVDMPNAVRNWNHAGFQLQILIGVGAMIAAINAPALLKCPRCSKRFGRTAIRIAARMWRTPVNFCPHCGVGLDEPYTKDA